MSYTEHHTGILKRRYDIEDIDSFFKNICIEDLGGEYANRLFSSYGNWHKIYKHYCDNTSYILGSDKKLYEIIEDNMNDECTTITDLGDGRFFFNSSFYNGGTWLNECLENALFEEK